MDGLYQKARHGRWTPFNQRLRVQRQADSGRSGTAAAGGSAEDKIGIMLPDLGYDLGVNVFIIMGFTIHITCVDVYNRSTGLAACQGIADNLFGGDGNMRRHLFGGHHAGDRRIDNELGVGCYRMRDS